MVSPARRAALDVLRAVHAGQRDLASALDHARTGLPDPRDRALASEIVHGVLRWRAALDHAIAWAGRRDVGAFDDVVLDVLRIGAYQLLHLTRVPASAAVDEAVESCRAAGSPRAAGAVNAILRAISRGRSRIPFPTEKEPAAYLSVTLSHPRWLAERWLDRLGADRAIAWARFDNAQPPVVLRAFSWRERREDLAVWLATQGIETEPARYAPDALVVTRGGPITTDVGLGRRFAVQDESSQLVAAFVGARPGERVLDACAAPGGKTTALAGALAGLGLLVAADLRPRRVRLLQRTLAAAEAARVPVVRMDAARAMPFGPAFDAVLLDAPCSGLGTIRRDPDVRWRREASDLAAFADSQARMLGEAARVVRPGGRLVYATCSSEPEENEDVVSRFLAARPGWRLATAAERAGELPARMRPCVTPEGWLRTAPDLHGLEPFFAACLRPPARV
jgi:16S rRNA (cytosine967-C5)-methyltransferase